MRKPSPASKNINWLGPPLASLAALLLFLLVLEVVLRITGSQAPFLFELHEKVCATHIPGLEATIAAPESSLLVRFNHAGYRDRDRDLRKPPGALRIAYLGDSFIEALQVPFAETSAQVLEKTLQKDLPERRLEVLNFGVSGFGTDCSYLTLHHRGFAYSPDVVVLAFYIGNDVYDVHPALAVEPYKPFFDRTSDGSFKLRPWKVSDNAVKRWLRGHSRAYSFLRDRIKRLAALHRMGIRLGFMHEVAPEKNKAGLGMDRLANNLYLAPPGPLIEEAWDLTDRILTRMAEEVKDRHIPLLVLIIPTGEQFDEEARRRYKEAMPPSLRDRLDFQLPGHRIRAILERHSIPYVDLLMLYSSRGLRAADLYDPQEGHWTALGNRIAGETLADAILRMLRGTPAVS